MLPQKKVQELPIVGNNVLDLLTLLGGLDNYVMTGAPGQSAFGREGATLAGVSAQAVPVLRDGIMVQDQRWPTGINAATVMNPDMVGEIKLIVAPVDAELGRGNGAIQISTRSGTNQFHGAATWNVQNTALNPNSWSNNRVQPVRNVPNWSNINQGTISAGGPIIKNKTFFFALWDMNFNRGRANTYVTVMTPCARNGVFRYFDGVNNGAFGAATTTGTTATTAVVDVNGNPVPPTPGAQLRHISVYGPVTFSGGAPNADCSNGSVSGSWDTFRTGLDSTGLVTRAINFMPAPNDWSTAGGGQRRWSECGELPISSWLYGPRQPVQRGRRNGQSQADQLETRPQRSPRTTRQTSDSPMNASLPTTRWQVCREPGATRTITGRQLLRSVSFLRFPGRW